MKTLEEQLDAAGLRVFGCCEKLSAYPDLLQHAPLLQDFSPAEADILGASMRLIRAEPGQVIIREGDAGEWMLMILRGTVDVTKRIEAVEADGADKEAAAPHPHDPAAVAPAKAAPVRSESDTPQAGPAAPEAMQGTRGNTGFLVSRVAVIQRGATLGEMSMLDSEPRYASCTALDTVEAAALGRREIAVLIRDHPGVGAKLLVKMTQLMAQRLRNTSNQLVKLLRTR